MFKKSLILLLTVVLALSAVLVGCGGNNNENVNDTTNETTNATNNATENTNNSTNDATVEEDNTAELEAAAKTNPAINRGNVLTVAETGFDGIFNPILYSNNTDAKITDLVFNGLIKVNKNGEYIPDVATWEVSEDKLTYTFSITSGIKFHNGEELTSDDVAFTYYSIADPDYVGARGPAVSDIVGVEAYRSGEVEVIEGINVIDDYTIAFTIEEPNVKKITDFSYGILNRDYYGYESMEQLEALNATPMGTGPMMFKVYEVGQYVELTTNEDYFEGRAYVDGVIYKVVPAATAAAAVNAGDVDVAEVSASLENYDTMTEAGIAEVQEFLGNSYRYIGINLRLEKFSDKRVRQALWYGLNLKDFIDAQWEGFAAPCLAPISPVSWAYPDTSELNSYDFNPEKASALLAEAGWLDTDGDGILDKDGEKLSIVWTSYNDVDWPLNLIAVAKENWGALGIELEGLLMEFTAVSDLVYEKQDFELYNMGWSLAIDPDPTAIFGEDADVLGGFNAIGFHHERANEIFRLGKSEYDQAKRAELYAEWAKIANEEVPYIFVSIGTTINGVNNRVHNLELDTYDGVAAQILDVELDHLDK